MFLLREDPQQPLIQNYHRMQTSKHFMPVVVGLGVIGVLAVGILAFGNMSGDTVNSTTPVEDRRTMYPDSLEKGMVQEESISSAESREDEGMIMKPLSADTSLDAIDKELEGTMILEEDFGDL